MCVSLSLPVEHTPPAESRTAVKRVAMLSVHTSPIAALGGKKTGGMNVYIKMLSRGLAAEGVCVDIFTRRTDPRQPDIDSGGLGVRVIYVDAGPPEALSTAESYHTLDAFTAGVLDFAASNSMTYDVIHAHYWLSGLVAERLQAAWGDVPLVQMFHTLGQMKNRIALTPDQQEISDRVAGEQRIMGHADFLVAATPAERMQMLWLYGADDERIRIIPPGVDLERFHPVPRPEARAYTGIAEDTRLLLFVGRLEPLKGLDTLLEAVSIAINKVPALHNTLRLAIIGGADPDNPEMQRLTALGDELGITAQVDFLGARGQDDLPYYYAAAEAVVMPSHYESFGMVALEAMACGTPVVASEVGGLAYLVQDGVTGLHFPYREPDALAERLVSILTDEEARQSMAAQAAAYARSYSWQHITRAILDLYEEALS